MTPQILYREAVLLHQAGKLEEAEQLYRQVVAAAPDNFPTRYMIALICYQQKRETKALEAVEAALRLNPDAPDALSLQGTLLQAMGRNEDAAASFDKAVAAKPGDASLWYNRGLV